MEHNGELSNLYFPDFNTLPGENDIDLDFYEDMGGNYFERRFLWVLLVHIRSIEKAIRWTVYGKDRDNKYIRIMPLY